MIYRTLEEKLRQLMRLYPVVSVTGPRQSGKTTLIRNTFSHLPYVNLENPDNRALALNDPRLFLSNYPQGAVLDEIQRTPLLFSYIQGIVDENEQVKFVLSGSQNFLLSEQISQSLAGRVGILQLLPFSMLELKSANLLSDSYEEVAVRGFYPRIFDKGIPAEDFYPNYMRTYVERDVRQLTQVGNLTTFSTFVKLCAGRVGQLLNMSELSNDAGIAVNTVKSWLNILEASYIVFRLYPHYKNFSKRLIKMPKLYFYDTGLLSYLLTINTPQDLFVHFARGAIFENLIITELIKNAYHRGNAPQLYFWRDHRGREIDLIVEKGQQLIPVEIKSGVTKTMDYFRNLSYWNELSGNAPDVSYVVYGGSETLNTKQGRLISWQSFITDNPMV
jgi:predicted AAA+ superfamily ATPase